MIDGQSSPACHAGTWHLVGEGFMEIIVHARHAKIQLTVKGWRT
jgi:hypothetical protein